MRYPIALLSTAILAVLSVSAGTISHPRTNIAGAAYSMTNDPSGNHIIIHSIATDGTVKFAGTVSNGGTGEHAPGATGPDALFSQLPIIVSGQHMFAVNPTSNTVTMFSINPNDPTQIKMVGKPVNSGGEFPISISMHPQTGNIYVLNGGRVNGVQIFTVNPITGLRPTGSFRSLHFNQTTPPNGPFDTISRILFNDDGSKLRVTVKGNATSPGFLGTWEVNRDGSLSTSLTKAVPPSISIGGLQFSMANVVGAKDAVIVSDVALGATIYDFSKPQTRFIPLTIPGEGAACWVEYSEQTDSYFLSDLFENDIYQVKVDKKTLQPTLFKTINLGDNNNALEIAISKVNGQEYLYVLTPSDASINVLELKTGNNTKVIQNYKFGSSLQKSGITFDTSNLEGMAIFLTGPGPHPIQSPL